MTDTTKKATARQRKRRAALNAIAQQLGYATWATLETAALNKQAQLEVKGRKPAPKQTINNDY